ncbi:hypothetical protein D9757_009289 [Collybiopsis confluens]|uniref:Transmembrane protein n=1 Tax=Collybiopsis confluens TaxID=2823264 RepID=A0A8H5HAD7_9AGAR|nr:hypothetical protein D9757_009289 [Collybiopsis confluens]
MEHSSQVLVIPCSTTLAGASDFLTLTHLVHGYAASVLPPPPSSATDLTTSFRFDSDAVQVAPVRNSFAALFPLQDAGSNTATFTSTSLPNTSQSAGADFLVVTTTSTITTFGGTVTTLVPITTSMSTAIQSSATAAIQVSATLHGTVILNSVTPTTTIFTSTSHNPPTSATAMPLSGSSSHTISPIPAIVGSVVGGLAFGLVIFLYMRCRRRLRQRAFHEMRPSTDLDIEESAAAEPTRRHPQLAPEHTPEEAVNFDEPSAARNSAQSLQQLETQQQFQYLDYPSSNHENLLLPPPADDSEFRVQMTEMRVTIERVLTHVQRLESRVGSTSRGKSQSVSMSDEWPSSISMSDGRPPTYVSSGN